MFDAAILIAWIILSLFLGFFTAIYLPQLKADLEGLKNALSEAIKEERRNAEFNQVRQDILEEYFNEACKSIAEEPTVTKRVNLALDLVQNRGEETDRRLRSKAANHKCRLTNSDYTKFHVINRLSDYLSVLRLLYYFVGANFFYFFHRAFRNASGLTDTATLKELMSVLKANTVEVFILFFILIVILHIFHSIKRFEQAQKEDVALF